MATNARDKAERCFALARSTTHDGERSNAIAAGTRIAEAAGFSLDLFDIPGRERKSAPRPAPSRYRDDLFRPSKAPEHYTAEEASDAVRRFREAMRAQMGPSAYADFAEGVRRTEDTLRRQAEALARTRAEVRRKTEERLADNAAKALWGKGWRVYRDADGEDGRRRWVAVGPSGVTFEDVDDARLVAIGAENGVGRNHGADPAPDYSAFHEYGSRRS